MEKEEIPVDKLKPEEQKLERRFTMSELRGWNMKKTAAVLGIAESTLRFSVPGDD